ncbi:biotin synthase BioB [Peptostreptococcus sp.]|jgi:biotin synthase|uniref:biotin synthase BioB n=1 Tax=Peptostreptococcus sp. TaxID=1262 RepID=UPI001CAFB005|nr:biotin synthase BioB [Peptostreptococcus sp.]
MDIKALYNRVIGGYLITREEALFLYKEDLGDLTRYADMIRDHFCGNQFDMCTIINGKSGLCSENCKFCAQSSHYNTGSKVYSLLSEEEILADAKKNADQGVMRYSIVTAGRSLSDGEVDRMCQIIRRIKEEVHISVCVSFGLLKEDQFRRLKEAGAERVHNNLEASENFFPSVCTSHSFSDKVQAIRAAQAAGMDVCSGGIMGLGEGIEDRIDMALSLRDLGIESIPVNMLNPIPGTPMEKYESLDEKEMQRIIAVYRFILPKAFIRLAGGRGLMSDKGKACFMSGANAAISGDMLTTAGITVDKDKKLLEELDYMIKPL